MPAELSRLQQVFLAIAEIADPAERAAALDRECGNDQSLRKRVEMLLAAHDDPVGLPGAAAEGSTAAYVTQFRDPAVGETFAGRYRLREKLGEGGMGVVFVADQSEPVQRRVALKIIRSNLPTAGLLSRFEQERQALALMDHPNIAKVFDAGVAGEPGSPRGIPYFVMELIKGVSITRYCDEARLTPRERLELFVPVCQAVQHAHQKGIIHRDLKPSNILVGLYDGRPVPKIIDFGVAKATGTKLTEESVYTEVGAVIGTLEYMSPEQAELNNLDIDTRTDIYALGAVLYELLTGSVPLSRKDLHTAGLAEMLRIIREVEPAKPSTRLSGSGSLPSIAACRHTDPKKLSRLFRGELDWIVMKALEKDRTRRFETANALALDIQRYLADEPVLAGPPSKLYRLRKFMRRNRGAVIGTAVVFLSLLVALSATAALLKRTREAKVHAEGNATRYKAMNEFLLEDLLGLAGAYEQADANLDPDPNIRLRTLLDRAAAKLDERFASQPDVATEVRATLAYSYYAVAEYLTAGALWDRVREYRRQALGLDHPETIAAIHERALCYRDDGKLDRAQPLYEEALAARRRVLGENHADTLRTMNHLGITLRRQDKLPEAIDLFEVVLREFRAIKGDGHDDTQQVINNLAIALQNSGRVDEALVMFKQNLDARRAAHGPNHVLTLDALDSLAHCYFRAGQLRLSMETYEQAVAGLSAKFGPDHPSTVSSKGGLASVYQYSGRLPEAIKLFEEALRASRVKPGATHPDTLRAAHNLANAYLKAKRWEAAETIYLEFLPTIRAQHGPDNYRTRLVTSSLAMAHIGRKDFGKADALVHTLLESLRRSPDADSDQSLFACEHLAGLLAAESQHVAAEAILRQCLAMREDRQPDDWKMFSVRSGLGHVLALQKKFVEAEPLLRSGYEGMKQREGKMSPKAKTELVEAVDRLIKLYSGMSKPDEVKKWQAERAKYPARQAPPATKQN